MNLVWVKSVKLSSVVVVRTERNETQRSELVMRQRSRGRFASVTSVWASVRIEMKKDAGCVRTSYGDSKKRGTRCQGLQRRSEVCVSCDNAVIGDGDGDDRCGRCTRSCVRLISKSKRTVQFLGVTIEKNSHKKKGKGAKSTTKGAELHSQRFGTESFFLHARKGRTPRQRGGGPREIHKKETKNRGRQQGELCVCASPVSN